MINLIVSARQVISIFAIAIILVGCKSNEDPVQPLMITSIHPTSGGKDTEIEITGAGFSTEASKHSVTVNGKAAVVISSTPTKLVVKAPSKAGTGKVSVSLDNQNTDGPTFSYVYKVTVSTFVGGSMGDDDGIGLAAKFVSPQGLTFDRQGNLYVTEWTKHRIRKINPDAKVTTIAGTGQKGLFDGPSLQAQFYDPYDIAIDKNNNLYVADRSNTYIRKISSDGIVSTLTHIASPIAIVINSTDNLYVVDQFKGLIQQCTLNGTVTKFSGAGNSAGGPFFMDGSRDVAVFNFPSGLAIDKENILYVADRVNNRVRKVANDGSVTTLAGTGDIGKVDGPGTQAKFNFPSGVDVDTDGNVYVTDERNYAIRMITKEGVVTTLAGGTPGYADGTQETAKFGFVASIAVDASGNLFVSDPDNFRIRKIVLE